MNETNFALPVTLNRDGDVVDANGTLIARTSSRLDGDCIVTAVNVHDELVSAAKAMLRVRLTGGGHKEDRAAREALHKAIVKAEGGVR